MIDRETIGFGAIVAVAAVVLHTVVHSGYTAISTFWEYGVWQANLPVMLVIVAGVTAFAAVVDMNLGPYRTAGAGIGLWLLHAVAHDGTHIVYEAPLGFGEVGVPESGIAIALTYAIGLVLIWARHR